MAKSPKSLTAPCNPCCSLLIDVATNIARYSLYLQPLLLVTRYLYNPCCLLLMIAATPVAIAQSSTNSQGLMHPQIVMSDAC